MRGTVERGGERERERAKRLEGGEREREGTEERESKEVAGGRERERGNRRERESKRIEVGERARAERWGERGGSPPRVNFHSLSLLLPFFFSLKIEEKIMSSALFLFSLFYRVSVF